MGSRDIKSLLGLILLVVGLGVAFFQVVFFVSFIWPNFNIFSLFFVVFLLLGTLILMGVGALLLFSARKGQRVEGEIRENGIDIQGTVVDYATSWYGRNTKRTAIVVKGDNGYQYISEGMLTKPMMLAFPLGSRIAVRIAPHNPQSYWIDVEGQSSIPLK